MRNISTEKNLSLLILVLSNDIFYSYQDYNLAQASHTILLCCKEYGFIFLQNTS